MDSSLRFTLVIPAAGNATRFGSNKVLALLAGEAVIARAVSAFVDHPSLAGVVIATQHPEPIRQACARAIERAADRGVPIDFVAGGGTRAESVHNAVRQAPAGVEWVAVHDAARPLVSRPLIDAALAAAARHGAATPAMPVALTIKEAAGPLPARVVRTVPRATLWAVQTPQVARRSALLDAFARCPIPFAQVTDDLQLLELVGVETWLVAGEEQNLKLTTAADLALAETFLRQRSE
jgi:2-C-methyl-D-erythritol 4-phosphate cytidylyltransferase